MGYQDPSRFIDACSHLRYELQLKIPSEDHTLGLPTYLGKAGSNSTL